MVRMCRVVVLALAAMALASSGCAQDGRAESWAYPHATMETTNETSAEHYARVSSIIAADRRTLAEDLDLLFQTERHGRLSRFHSR